MIKAEDLIWRFYSSLQDHWGYIYGATHEMWSEAKQREYVSRYSDDPDRQNSCRYGGQWAGHWVTDCSGLFHYWFAQLGGKIAHGSNSIWDKYCQDQGTLSGGRRTDGSEMLPGTAVFTSNSAGRHNHIGLYAGNGVVIEAQGAQNGVTTSSISNKKWTHWGTLRGVEYSEQGEKGDVDYMQATVVLPAGKSGSTVNMRKAASTKADIIVRVPVGSVVEVADDQGQWCQIIYNGKTGWMQSNYLEYEGQQDETDDHVGPEQISRVMELVAQGRKALADAADAFEAIEDIFAKG